MLPTIYEGTCESQSLGPSLVAPNRSAVRDSESPSNVPSDLYSDEDFRERQFGELSTSNTFQEASRKRNFLFLAVVLISFGVGAGFAFMLVPQKQDSSPKDQANKNPEGNNSDRGSVPTTNAPRWNTGTPTFAPVPVIPVPRETNAPILWKPVQPSSGPRDPIRPLAKPAVAPTSMPTNNASIHCSEFSWNSTENPCDAENLNDQVAQSGIVNVKATTYKIFARQAATLQSCETPNLMLSLACSMNATLENTWNNVLCTEVNTSHISCTLSSPRTINSITVTCYGEEDNLTVQATSEGATCESVGEFELSLGALVYCDESGTLLPSNFECTQDSATALDNEPFQCTVRQRCVSANLDGISGCEVSTQAGIVVEPIANSTCEADTDADDTEDGQPCPDNEVGCAPQNTNSTCSTNRDCPSNVCLEGHCQEDMVGSNLMPADLVVPATKRPRDEAGPLFSDNP